MGVIDHEVTMKHLFAVLVLALGASLSTMFIHPSFAYADSAYTLLSFTPVIMTTAAAADQTDQPVVHKTWGQLKVLYRGNDTPSVSNQSSSQSARVGLKPGATTMAVSYPTSYYLLYVPWLSQFSNGGQDCCSRNCGQTCSLMIDGYYRHYAPTAANLNSLDWWLVGRYGGAYAPANSHDTWFGGTNPLGNVIGSYFGYAYYYQNAGSVDDLSRLFTAVRNGVPVIVGVLESGGMLSTSSGYAHWVILVGYEQDTGEVIINDPGTSYSSKGYFHHYPISYFDASWRTQGRIWAPVESGMCRYF